MVRSEALKRAQKKYQQKIKEENTLVYQNIKKKQNEYLSNYIKQRKLIDPEYKEKLMHNNKICAQVHYKKYQPMILKRRKQLRDIKKNNDLHDFLKNNIIEISIDF